MAKRINPTAREWVFIKHYAINFNATEAYKEAVGETNNNNAAVQGHRMLKSDIVDEHLSTYIQEILGPQEKTLLGNVAFWISIRDDTHPKEWVSFEDLEKILDSDALDEIREKGRVAQLPAAKTADRLKASEHLAKYAQMFVEKKQIETTATVQIVDDIK